MTKELLQTDVLIIGSGIAGLSYALKVAQAHPNRQILVLTKANRDESNTKYAQGGIAAVIGDGECPEARALGLRCVRFPLYPALTSKEVATIERVLSTLP